MHGQDEFAARLGRIQSRNGGAVPAGPGAPPPPAPPPVGGGGPQGPAPGRAPNPGLKFAVIMVPLVGLLGALTFVGTMTSLPDMMKAEVAARLQGESAPQADEPSWLSRMILREPSGSPEDFLPEAPKGWMRVTASDAEGATAAALAEALYPERVTGRTWYPIEQNIGFASFEKFVKLRSSPDTEQRVLSRKYGNAVFLSTDGMFLRFSLRVVGENGFFGAVDAPEEWLEYVETRSRRRSSTNEIVERLTIAGIESINRTKEPGTDLLRRPVSGSYNLPNTLEITVPLWHRAYLEIKGMASPNDVSEIVAMMDLDALRDTYR